MEPNKKSEKLVNTSFLSQFLLDNDNNNSESTDKKLPAANKVINY